MFLVFASNLTGSRLQLVERSSDLSPSWSIVAGPRSLFVAAACLDDGQTDKKKHARTTRAKFKRGIPVRVRVSLLAKDKIRLLLQDSGFHC